MIIMKLLIIIVLIIYVIILKQIKVIKNKIFNFKRANQFKMEFYQMDLIQLLFFMWKILELY